MYTHTCKRDLTSLYIDIAEFFTDQLWKMYNACFIVSPTPVLPMTNLTDYI